MIQKSELIKKVKYHFCLNAYESKVWLALLNKTIASVGEIAEISDVPRSRVYDVLESLEKGGFAIAKLGKPVKYIAVKPSIVIEHMKNNMVRESEEKVKVLTNIKDSLEYRELEILHHKGIKPIQIEDLSSAIHGKQKIYAHLKELISNAEKEIIIVSTTKALKRKLHSLGPLLVKLKDRGVNINLAASANDLIDNEEKLELVNLSKELKIPIKKIKIDVRLCIIDGAKILVFTNADRGDNNDTALWINSPFFGKALTTFLNPIWRTQK